MVGKTFSCAKNDGHAMGRGDVDYPAAAVNQQVRRLARGPRVASRRSSYYYYLSSVETENRTFLRRRQGFGR